MDPVASRSLKVRQPTPLLKLATQAMVLQVSFWVICPLPAIRSLCVSQRILVTIRPFTHRTRTRLRRAFNYYSVYAIQSMFRSANRQTIDPTLVRLHLIQGPATFQVLS